MIPVRIFDHKGEDFYWYFLGYGLSFISVLNGYMPLAAANCAAGTEAKVVLKLGFLSGIEKPRGVGGNVGH